MSAAIHRFEGQALTCVPGRGPCYRCLFPEPPADGLVPNCAQAGVLGVLPGVLGTIQATEAIKIITGIGETLIGRVLTCDALEMCFDEFRVASPESVHRLSAQQLQALLDDASLVLVDVREPHEFQAGFLPGALNIPLVELADRLAELPPGRTSTAACWRGRGTWITRLWSSEYGSDVVQYRLLF